MALPKEIRDRGKLLNFFACGFTTIRIDNKKNTIVVEHSGNMGNSIKDVEDNFNLCLGKGAFKRLGNSCKSMDEEGSPDYYYERIMTF